MGSKSTWLERDREREKESVAEFRRSILHQEAKFCPIEEFLQLLCGSSAQINLYTLLIFFDDQVEVLFRRNCSEAKEGAVRVEFSPDQYQGRFPKDSFIAGGWTIWITVLTLSPNAGLAMRFPLLEARSWQEAKSNLVTVALGRGVNFMTLTGSSLARHVALQDHGVGLDGQLCSCLIVCWPVGSFISNPGCWTVDRSCSCLIVGRWVDLCLGRRSDTVLVSTINDADQGSADVAFRTPLAPYEKSKFLGSGWSMVAWLKLKGIDGRAPPRVEPVA
ncbi:hypothetical protein YC2023_066030 [Brassica napus]